MIINISETTIRIAEDLFDSNSDIIYGHLNEFDKQTLSAENLRKIAIQRFLAGTGQGIVKSDIQLLSDNYEKFTQKVDKVTGKGRKIKKKKSVGGAIDSKCATFGLSEIVNFLNLNGVPISFNGSSTGTVVDDYAVRIYYGQHEEETLPNTGIKLPVVDYATNRQLTVILVAAKKTNGEYTDILNSTSSGAPGAVAIPDGLEVASLCPPNCNGGDGID
jgi:hypothetical protein